MGSISRTIALAVDAERDGKRDLARAILLHAVERDADNDHAWALLSEVLDDPEKARACLEKAIDLNPANEFARRKLEWERRREGRASRAVAGRDTGNGPRLGEYLVRHYGLDWVTLMRAIFQQRALAEEGDARLLGQVLVEMGAVDEVALYDALAEHHGLMRRSA
jgi:hypothetical protein